MAGARDLANFLANDEMAQRSFITQLFHYYVKQPVAAYGDQQLDHLHEEFVASKFNIRQLLIEIALVTCLPEPQGSQTNETGAEVSGDSPSVLNR